MRMIVVAHYDLGFRLAMVKFLMMEGYDAAHVATGDEALAKMRGQPPNFLLLNGTLQDMDGLKLLRGIRADKSLAELPICFVSNLESREGEAKPYGIQAFLQKPFSGQALLDVVAQWCSPPATRV